MDINVPYQLARTEVGKPAAFDIFDPEEIVDIAPDSRLRSQFTIPPVLETEISNVVPLSEHSTSTERKLIFSTGMYHSEGGWPKDVDPSEPEQMARYKRKCEKEDNYFPAARQLFLALRPALRQNNAIDIYGPTIHDDGAHQIDDSNPTDVVRLSDSHHDPMAGTHDNKGHPHSSTADVDEAGGEATDASPSQTLLSLRTTIIDPLISTEKTNQLKRVATSLSWHSADSLRHKLAVAYCPVEGGMSGSQLTATGDPVSSYVFDVNMPHQPETTLTAPTSMTVLTWSPRDLHILAGGCCDATVCLFDVRRPPKPISKTIPSRGTGGGAAAAMGRVTGLLWLQVASKAVELFTVHGTNTCFVWDIRNFSEPIDVIKISTKGSSINHGALCADYSASTLGPGRILVGTNSGSVFALTRRGRSEGDRVQATFGPHHSAVSAVQRHPLLPKCFATAGDWCVRIWSEEVKVPVLVLPWNDSPVVDLAWHPTRPSILACATADGEVQLWNLLYRADRPRASYHHTGITLHSLSFNFDGTMLTLGCTDGTVAIVNLSAELLATESTQMDKVALQALLDRDVLREKVVLTEYKDIFAGTTTRTPLSTTTSDTSQASPTRRMAATFASASEPNIDPTTRQALELYGSPEMDGLLADAAQDFRSSVVRMHEGGLTNAGLSSRKPSMSQQPDSVNVEEGLPSAFFADDDESDDTWSSDRGSPTPTRSTPSLQYGRGSGSVPVLADEHFRGQPSAAELIGPREPTYTPSPPPQATYRSREDVPIGGVRERRRSDAGGSATPPPSSVVAEDDSDVPPASAASPLVSSRTPKRPQTATTTRTARRTTFDTM